MKPNHKYVGLDVHKERIEVALAESSGEVRLYGSISNDLHAPEKLLSKLRADGSTLHVVYEAGPCGFVIAPSGGPACGLPQLSAACATGHRLHCGRAVADPEEERRPGQD